MIVQWWLNGGSVVVSWDLMAILPSGNDKQFANWKMAIEILGFPSKRSDLTHSYVSLPEGINGQWSDDLW